MNYEFRDSYYVRLLDNVRKLYDARLLALAIFGSYACGNPRDDSDMDVLVVAEPLPDGRMKRVDEWMKAEHGWEGPFLSPVFYTPDELEEGSPVFLNMTLGEVTILHDPGSVLKEYLERFTARLKKMGAHRLGSGKSSYWIMGPDTGSEVSL